jgi:hypothetical protein
MDLPRVHETTHSNQEPAAPSTADLLAAERRRVELLQQVVRLQAAEIANLRSGQEARY